MQEELLAVQQVKVALVGVMEFVAEVDCMVVGVQAMVQMVLLVMVVAVLCVFYGQDALDLSPQLA